jgi:hypothetical protein
LNPPDQALNTLLDLDGYVLEQESGFWIKIEAKRIDPTEFIPHGIRYSLTLHNRHGKRTASDKGVPYTFNSTQGLLEEFFAEVDKAIATAIQGD